MGLDLIGGSSVSTPNGGGVIQQTAEGDDSVSFDTDYSGSVSGSITHSEPVSHKNSFVSLCFAVNGFFIFYCYDEGSDLNSWASFASEGNVLNVNLSVANGRRFYCVFSPTGEFVRGANANNGSSGYTDTFSVYSFETHLATKDPKGQR